MYDFGIFIELQPDDEEKAMLENNIQMALQQQTIELEDAVDLRELKNIKLANQLLKIRRAKKQERDRRLQLENIQAQTQANQQSAQTAAQLEVQKAQAKTQSEVELAQVKAQLEAQKMQQEIEAKKQLMEIEFQYNMQLKNMDVGQVEKREAQKEDRKDERTRIQASQQSQLIEQRNQGAPAKSFESAGNDTIGGGFDLEAFEPR